MNLTGACGIGTVGPPLPSTEIQIAPDGEILLRSPGVMQCYWRAASATAQALDGGWLHTSDLGDLDARGYLCINRREKPLDHLLLRVVSVPVRDGEFVVQSSNASFEILAPHHFETSRMHSKTWRGDLATSMVAVRSRVVGLISFLPDRIADSYHRGAPQ